MQLKNKSAFSPTLQFILTKYCTNIKYISIHTIYVFPDISYTLYLLNPAPRPLTVLSLRRPPKQLGYALPGLVPPLKVSLSQEHALLQDYLLASASRNQKQII